MRYRLMATYLGVPYHIGLGPDGTEATLFSPGPPPDELGFSAAGGHWRKQVSVTDLGALWQSRLVGDYRGEPCLVLDDLGDRLHIAYQGRDSMRARQLGYWEIDREVFEVVVARQDVTGLTEERVEFPLSSAMFPPSNAGQETQARQDAPGRAVPLTQGGPPPAVIERTSPLRAMPRSAPPPGAPAGPPPGTPAGPSAASGGGGYADRGSGIPDRGSSIPDRVAAWHGSPEPWSEPEPEPRPEPRLEPRQEAHLEPRQEPRLDPRQEPRLDPRQETRLEPRQEGRPESRPDPRPEPRQEPRFEPRPESRLEPRPEPWSELGPEPWPDPRSDPRSELGPEPWPDPRSDPRSQLGPDPRSDPRAVPWAEREPLAAADTWAPAEASPPQGRRAGRRDRVPQSVFAELLSLAAIPQTAYVVDEEIPGAMCLVKADGGFEVFSRTDDARLDEHFFEDEEAAYFYLFGVLAAEAVRSGRLQPARINGFANGSRGPRVPSGSTENVSKYLRSRKLPKSASPPAMVN